MSLTTEDKLRECLSATANGGYSDVRARSMNGNEIPYTLLDIKVREVTNIFKSRTLWQRIRNK